MPRLVLVFAWTRLKVGRVLLVKKWWPVRREPEPRGWMGEGSCRGGRAFWARMEGTVVRG